MFIQADLMFPTDVVQFTSFTLESRGNRIVFFHFWNDRLTPTRKQIRRKKQCNAKIWGSPVQTFNSLCTLARSSFPTLAPQVTTEKTCCIKNTWRVRQLPRSVIFAPKSALLLHFKGPNGLCAKVRLSRKVVCGFLATLRKIMHVDNLNATEVMVGPGKYRVH